jgi:hypothetical protein
MNIGNVTIVTGFCPNLTARAGYAYFINKTSISGAFQDNNKFHEKFTNENFLVIR